MTPLCILLQPLLCNTLLLPKLVQRDKLNCLVLNLYPGNEGYSLMLKSKTGIETETVKLPYEVSFFFLFFFHSPAIFSGEGGSEGGVHIVL